MRVIVNEGGSVDWNEEIYLPGKPIDLPEKEALRLIAKGAVRPADDDGIIARASAPEEMTVPKLKELLDKLEVEYPVKANKAELVDLVKQNTATPPED